MSVGRLFYRLRQFRFALEAAPAPQEFEQVKWVLSPALMEVFRRMQPSEQAHSLMVFKRLEEGGQTDPDLLGAALLHDVGKSRFPLNVWERVLIVLVHSLFPMVAVRLGQFSPGSGQERPGWLYKPFVVAQNHPAWGAEMVEQAGASSRMCAFIRRHQDPIVTAKTPEEQLLLVLKRVDDQS